MSDKKWECIFKTSGLTNAQIIAGRLEAEGVPTQLNARFHRVSLKSGHHQVKCFFRCIVG